MSQGKLLVVEDDAGLREALIDTLLLAGYDCQEVDCGESAVDGGMDPGLLCAHVGHTR